MHFNKENVDIEVLSQSTFLLLNPIFLFFVLTYQSVMLMFTLNKMNYFILYSTGYYQSNNLTRYKASTFIYCLQYLLSVQHWSQEPRPVLMVGWTQASWTWVVSSSSPAP